MLVVLETQRRHQQQNVNFPKAVWVPVRRQTLAPATQRDPSVRNQSKAAFATVRRTKLDLQFRINLT